MPLLNSLRFEEWLVLTAAVCGCILLPARPSRRLRQASAVAAAGIVAWQLWLRGLHWQFAPVLIALSVLALLLLHPADFGWSSAMERPRARRLAALLCFCLTLCSAGLAWALPLFRLPAPTGPYSVGTRLEHWTDPATRRELALTIWYPAGATTPRPARYVRLRETRPLFAYQPWLRTNAFVEAPVAPGPFPLLLFGHMWGGRRAQDTFLAEDLASHGYVVVSPDHPGNSLRTENADGSITSGLRAHALDDLERDSAAGVEAMWEQEQRLWIGDDRFVLATLAAESRRAGSWLAGALDLSRVGAFGHSFGGSVAVALLGQPASPAVPAVRSAINMDGWSFGALDRRTTEPVLFLYESSESGRVGGTPTDGSVNSQLERLDQAAVRASVAARGGSIAYLRGAYHADFCDQTLYSPLRRLTWGGPIGGPRGRLILRQTVLAFFNRTLLGRPGPLPGFPELQVEPPARSSGAFPLAPT